MDEFVVRNRLRYISDFVHTIDKDIKPLNFYPAQCMTLLIAWIDELLEISHEEVIESFELAMHNAEHRKDVLEG